MGSLLVWLDTQGRVLPQVSLGGLKPRQGQVQDSAGQRCRYSAGAWAGAM